MKCCCFTLQVVKLYQARNTKTFTFHSSSSKFGETCSMKYSRFVLQTVKAVRSLETWLGVVLDDNVTHHCVLEKSITAKPQGF